MSALPAPPSAPLHLLPDLAFLITRLLAWGLAAGALTAKLVARLRGHWQAAAQPPAAAAPAPARPAGFGEEIEALRRAVLGEGDFRRGCHLLADLIKSLVTQRTGLAASKMTGHELARRLRDPAASRLITELALRCFGKEPPRRSDFLAYCDRARQTLGQRKLEVRG